MIKVKTEDGVTELNMSGKFPEIESDIVMILKSIYNGIAQSNKFLAKKFEQDFKVIFPYLVFGIGADEANGKIDSRLKEFIEELEKFDVQSDTSGVPE